VNWAQFSAVLWLRWRMRMHQFQRAGVVNAVLTMMFLAACVPGAVVLFVAAIFVGALGLPHVSPDVVLLIWDGLVFFFLMAWSIGLMAELQRSEALSLDKFLHLPISLTNVFIINYLSSLLSLNLLAFVPIMVGLAIGMTVGVTPAMVLLLPLVIAFLFALTALTYQFQGWLATLMSNPRRRRTVIVLVTMVFILISQSGNLINILGPWRHYDRQDRAAARHFEEELKKVQDARARGEITDEEHGQEVQRLNDERQEHQSQEGRRDAQIWGQMKDVAWVANMVLPPGWLPLGAASLMANNVVPALLGTVGFTLIGGASLWRAYRTTIRLYTGQFTAGSRKAAAPAPVPAAARASGGQPAVAFLERTLPGLSERASAIALTSFRSLIRAPEVKMLLIGPVMFMFFVGSLLLSSPAADRPAAVGPFLPLAGMAFFLIFMTQLIGNQFGFDRAGFRVFVLCPAPRREVILGKNLAAAPLALSMGLVALIVVEILLPLRLDHVLAILLQMVAMYLTYCMLANLLSIYVPMAINPGSMKPTNWKTVPQLIYMGFVMFCFAGMAPAFLPLGIELLIEHFASIHGLPIALGLTVLECAAIVLIYRVVVNWEGNLLQAREQKILETVAAKAE
jgi:hypothetical protein